MNQWAAVWKFSSAPDGISFNATATISALDNPLDAIKRERERKIKGENKSGRRYDEMDLERLHFHAMRLASNSTAVRLNCGRGKDATRSKGEQQMMRLPFVLRSPIGRWERWPDIESFQVLPDISRKGKERSDYFERAIITRHWERSKCLEKCDAFSQWTKVPGRHLNHMKIQNKHFQSSFFFLSFSFAQSTGIVWPLIPTRSFR